MTDSSDDFFSSFETIPMQQRAQGSTGVTKSHVGPPIHGGVTQRGTTGLPPTPPGPPPPGPPPPPQSHRTTDSSAPMPAATNRRLTSSMKPSNGVTSKMGGSTPAVANTGETKTNLPSSTRRLGAGVATKPLTKNPYSSATPTANLSSSYYNQGSSGHFSNAPASSTAQNYAQSSGDVLGSDWYSPPQSLQPQQQQVPQQTLQQQQPALFQAQPMVSSTMPSSYGGYGGTYGTAAASGSAHQQQHYAQSTPSSVSQLEGSMDSNSQVVTPVNSSMFAPQPSIMNPYAMFSNTLNVVNPTTTGTSLDASAMQSGGYNDIDDLSNEPPLLEELGINIEHIAMKTRAIVIPFRRFSKNNSALIDPSVIVEDADLAGPLAFALLLGGELMLAGKLQFGYIYGFGMFGCMSMTLILNLMTPGSTAVSFWTVTSILGYALLPVNLLAAVKIVLSNIAGFLTLTQYLAVLTVLWSTFASTRLLEVGCGMEAQRFLVAYPIALLYSAFVLITIF